MENHERIIDALCRNLFDRKPKKYYPNWGEEPVSKCENFDTETFQPCSSMNQPPQLPDVSLIIPWQLPPSTVISILRGQVHLPVNKIIRLEGERNYTRFVLADGRKIMTCKNLSFYEGILPDIFARIHKKYLLNRDYITDLGKFQIRMSDGFEVNIARRKRGSCKTILSQNREYLIK